MFFSCSASISITLAIRTRPPARPAGLNRFEKCVGHGNPKDGRVCYWGSPSSAVGRFSSRVAEQPANFAKAFLGGGIVGEVSAHDFGDSNSRTMSHFSALLSVRSGSRSRAVRRSMSRAVVEAPHASSSLIISMLRRHAA